MACQWGQRLVKEMHSLPEERIRSMFITAFARSPSEVELKALASAAREFASPGQCDLMKDEAAWTPAGHAIFNTKEFLYYR